MEAFVSIPAHSQSQKSPPGGGVVESLFPVSYSLPPEREVSLVGNSLGGLYTRFAVGELFDEATGTLEGAIYIYIYMDTCIYVSISLSLYIYIYIHIHTDINNDIDNNDN